MHKQLPCNRDQATPFDGRRRQSDIYVDLNSIRVVISGSKSNFLCPTGMRA